MSCAQLSSRSPYDGLKVGSKVQVTLELVRDDYFVVSLPAASNSASVALPCTVFGNALTKSHNWRVLPHAIFHAGQRCEATVVCLPRVVVCTEATVSGKKDKKRKTPDTVMSLSSVLEDCSRLLLVVDVKPVLTKV